MTMKELIRREIERRIEWLNTVTNDFSEGRRAELRSLYDFLDTLPDESEQPTRGYDEAYLNEKIAKASKSWEGVDVDKFMDEIRGREPVTNCHDLTEAAAFEYERTRNDLDARSDNEVARRAFIAGAKWMNRKMMDEAYEVEVQEVYRDDDGIHCCVSVGTDYKPGTIVYVITIHKEGEQ